jgi:colanic acid biosynthesis glycosyl transferase WcaI
MKSKRVLIHSIVFSPDGVSTAYLYNDIAIGLVENGFEVIVLTTTPHYNVIDAELKKQPFKKKLFGIYFVSEFRGIKVFHVPLIKFNSLIIRILSFLYWHIISLLIGISIRNIDYVLSPSPPLSIGFVSLLIAKFKRAKSVYNVQEIYPDLLINQGKLTSVRLIKLLKYFEQVVYNNSDAVITIDEVFYSTISSRINNPKKLHIIPNFVDTELYKPLDKKLSLPLVFGEGNGNIKLLYAGNIGYFQDWSPVFYAANQLKDENIEFWIIGEGVQKTELEKEVLKLNLTNIRIFPYQSREFLPAINNYVDIHFMAINPKMEQEGFPSKIYTIMACAKPIIVVTGKKTPLYNFLKDKYCSELISDNRNENFTDAIRKLAKNNKIREEMGNSGFNEIKNNYSKHVVISKYINLLKSI